MVDVQFNLRIPAELKDRVKDAAVQSGRSINAEAQYRLEQSFKHQADLIAIAQSTSYSVKNGLEAMQAALDKIMKLQDELDAKSEQIKQLTKNQEK